MTDPYGEQRAPDNNDDDDSCEIENRYARPLFINGRAESADFGTVRAPGPVGDLLFGRRDGKDLSCQHLVCLAAFCKVVVEAFLRLEGGRGGEEDEDEEEEERRGAVRRKRGRGRRGRGRSEKKKSKGKDVEVGRRERGMRFRGMVTPEEFQGYWVRWCRKKFDASGLEAWLRCKGPFDV